jgi:signal transduction histidine kinase
MLNKPGKILIVDDDPQIVVDLKKYLSDDGYSPFLASKSSDALEMLINEKDYDVVLLEINMPTLDGVTVLKRLQDAGCDTAVIMMTGHGSEELAVECMRNGAEDYISKPFALEDMLLRIERARAHHIDLIEKRQLQQEKEEFILMLSHEMKNPLTAVIGSIDIIREECLGPINEEQADYLQSAIDSCNEVVVMIDNLNDIRKFETEKIQMSICTYNAHDLITKIATQFARQAKHYGIKFNVCLGSGTAKISVDKSSFSRVLGNLFGNALKFSPEGGTISVSTHEFTAKALHTLKIPGHTTLPPVFNQTGSCIKITVSDTGNGIAGDELHHIFDRYAQFTGNAVRERGGAGLGLAYCKLAVESFNGMIWAEPEDGEGSEFVILLPCSNEDSK